MAETIKEFLVSIGYRVDGSSERRFEDSMKRATLRAELLGRAIASAAEAVVRGATRIAQGFDEIYYASQRTKASVENMKSLSYAVSQLGGSYSGAMQSIEAFGARLRNNPGYDSMVRGLGIATKDGNNRLRDTATIMTELSKKLASRPRHEAIAYLEALGIDERTFDALKSGDLVRYTEEYRKKQEQLGVDQNRLAVVGKDLTVAWRSLSLTLGTMGDKILQSVGPALTKLVDKLDKFVTDNAPAIEKFFAKLTEWLEKVLDAFIQLVEKGEGPIVDMFKKIGDSVDTLTTVLTAFAAFLVGTWLVRVLGAFASVGSGFAGMLLALGMSPAALGALGIAGLGAGAYALNESDKDFSARKNAIENPGGRNPFAAIDERDAARYPKDKRNWWQRTMPKFLGGRDAPSASSSGAGDSKVHIRPGSFSAKAPGIMKRLQEDFGITEEQAAGVLGNLGHESSGLKDLQEKNPTVPGSRGGYGWAQWTGPRRRAFEAWAAEKGLDPASDEANYGFLKHELRTTHRNAIRRLKETNSTEDATRVFEETYEQAGIKHYPSREKWANRALAAARRAREVQPYGGPALPPLARMQSVQENAASFGGGSGTAGPAPLTPSASGGSTVTMQQKTDITVIGSSDPVATGNAVNSAQDRVNGTMTRNLQGAVR